MKEFSGELGQGRKSQFQKEFEMVKKLKSQGKDPYKYVGNLR